MGLLSHIFALRPPFLHLVTDEHAVLYVMLEASVHNFEENNCYFRIIEGSECRDVNSLMKEFAIKLKFPPQTENSWAAFDACLNDLRWITAEKFIFIIRDFDQLLVDDEQNFVIFSNILQDAVKEWTTGRGYHSLPTPPTPFHVALHVPRLDKPAIYERLSYLNITEMGKLLLLAR